LTEGGFIIYNEPLVEAARRGYGSLKGPL